MTTTASNAIYDREQSTCSQHHERGHSEALYISARMASRCFLNSIIRSSPALDLVNQTSESTISTPKRLEGALICVHILGTSFYLLFSFLDGNTRKK